MRTWTVTAPAAAWRCCTGPTFTCARHPHHVCCDSKQKEFSARKQDSLTICLGMDWSQNYQHYENTLMKLKKYRVRVGFVLFWRKNVSAIVFFSGESTVLSNSQRQVK